MPPQNPYSSFADPNSFLGQPLLPRLGRALSGMFSSMGQTLGATPPMPAGVRPIPQGVQAPNINPIPFLQGLNPLANTPLIGGAAQGRGPRQEPPTPTVPTFPSGRPIGGFDIYPTVPQMPPTVPPQTSQFAAVNPRPATADDIDAFYGRGAYAPQPTTPVEPATPQRVGVRTAYGMVYPTRGQDESGRSLDQTAAAQRLAQMPRMGARLQNVREQLTQQDRLERARQGGREMAKRIAKANEDYFASQRGGVQPQQQTVAQSRPQRPSQAGGGQTRQRSWSNYTGRNPIGNFEYEDGETNEPTRRDRRRELA
jgi:hypothetical protein